MGREDCLPARFWSKVEKMPNGCWEWRAAHSNGYGRFNLKGRLRLPHVLTMEELYGPIPEGKEVCHKCDNPSCCNPEHLFVGTRSENMLDAGRKGRLGKSRKYGEDKVEEAIALYAAGLSWHEISRRLGTNRASMRYAVRRRSHG